jgi:hypothetical protein
MGLFREVGMAPFFNFYGYLIVTGALGRRFFYIRGNYGT